MPYRKFLNRIGTERQQIEFLHSIFDSLPSAVFTKDIDDDMRILTWNKSAEELLGISATEALGKNVFEIFPEELARNYDSDDRRVAKGNVPVFLPDRESVNSRTQQACYVRVWKVPVKTERGHVLLCIVQDRTEIRKAEAETREQEQRLTIISNNLSGLLYQFRMDPNGRFSFTYFSKQARESLGVSAEEICKDAQAIIGLIHKDDMPGFEQSLLKTITALTPWRWEGRFWANGKVLRWFQGSSEPRKQDDGSIIWDGMLIDITAQKIAEEQLKFQEAQLVGTSRLVALGEMAGGVAHEINTPLNAILFCAEQIQLSLEESNLNKDELLEMSSLIVETSQRIAKIVRGLKTFAREGSKDAMEEIDVGNMIDDTLSLCSQRLQQNGVKLEFRKPETEIKISGRAVQLGQVILNLINNSFDAINRAQGSWIKIEIKTNFESVFIEITDSGKGLSPEVKSKLFQPFFTTKGPGKGTGIGLSISQGIVAAHHGSLYLDESSANTKFVIELPNLINQVHTGVA